MKIHEYLLQHREPCPQWLINFNEKDGFDHKEFFSSRVVFYPGYGSDGQAVKLFSASHSAHCFVYVDSLTPREQVVRDLDVPQRGYSSRFLGYRCLARVDVTPEQLAPIGWTQHAKAPADHFAKPHIKPFGFIEILERNAELTDEHGAQRLAILFLGADGHATYDALFCQRNNRPAPYAVLLQDHGFGGNYSNFGADGLMEQIARATQVLPEWLIVGTQTKAWLGYHAMEGVESDRGGWHKDQRSLYRLE